MIDREEGDELDDEDEEDSDQDYDHSTYEKFFQEGEIKFTQLVNLGQKSGSKMRFPLVYCYTSKLLTRQVRLLVIHLKAGSDYSNSAVTSD